MFVMNQHIACSISMQNSCMTKLFVQKYKKIYADMRTNYIYKIIAPNKS